MSRARHKHRASGGKLSSKPEFEAGGESNAAKEAEERKHGGKVKHHGEGEKSKHRGDKAPRRARGGKVSHEPHHEVKSHSMKHHHGMHIPGRKRGGGIGSNLHPLTTAAKVTHITPGEQPEEGDHSD
jgi:hypothetical protein